MSYGIAAALHHGHLFTVHRMPAYGGIHRAAVLPYVAVHYCDICSMCAVVLQLRRKGGVSHIVFRHDYKARGQLVYPVDYARAYLSAYAGKPLEVIHEGVYQRAVGIAGSRVYHHSLGLVYYRYVRILVNYVYWYVLRHYIHFLRRAKGYCHGISCPELVL